LRPDVIHAHQVGALWYLGPAARAAGRIPVLFTEHIDHVGKSVGWRKKVKARLLLNRAARYAQKLCGVSEDVSRSMARWGTVPAGKVATVLNGIDTDRYADTSSRSAVRKELGVPPAARLIGTVGRLSEVKRQDLLLRAVAGFGSGREDVRVLLVGDGHERQRLERLAADLGLGARAIFAGYQPNPERFLPAMDVFALTSRLEGLPLALLEAWAAGLPVVSSAVGGIPDVVTDGATGFLFPFGDEPALVAALRKVVTDPDTAARVGSAGQAVVRKRYSLVRMAANYEAMYRDLLAHRREASIRRPTAAAGEANGRDLLTGR
jgi:glycosyltransferase involved in cell wall biosynthesis